MLGNKGKPETGITLIASNCEITGDVHFSDQLQVNGVVKGNIYAQEGTKAHVTISEKGEVKGEIRAPNVVVNGKVHGDIYSDKHIELAARAEIKGNVFYNLIEMVMGSRVDGKLVHVENGKEVKADDKPITERDRVPQVERADTRSTALEAMAGHEANLAQKTTAQVSAIPGKAS